MGPLWFSTSPQAIATGLNILLRALGAAAAMNFLALTTPLVDLVELFRRWRVPPEIIDLMTLIYRFIFVLLESLERMQMAQASRLGYQAPYLRAMNNAALLGSRLFIDTFQRSRRLQLALESRGFSGDLRVLPATYTHDPRLGRAAILIVITLGLTWLLV
ncbi:MAG: hypothetical protein Kow0031_23350 [Anaerolineae bacterium]